MGADSDCGYCVAEEKNRAFPHKQALSKPNTPEVCIKACSEGGYKFAGVQYGSQCFCGNTAPAATNKIANEECDMKCSGDSNYMCGGSWKMNVYELSKNCPAAPAAPDSPGLLWLL